MQSAHKTKVRANYGTPTLKPLEPEKAMQFLLHHARMGDAGAKEILELVLRRDDNRER